MNILKRFKSIKTFVFDVDGVLTDGTLLILNDGQMARQNAITRAQDPVFANPLSVQECAVLATRIPQIPLISMTFQNEMLARQSGVLRVAEFIRCGPSQRHSFARQRERDGRPVRRYDREFGHRRITTTQIYLCKIADI